LWERSIDREAVRRSGTCISITFAFAINGSLLRRDWLSNVRNDVLAGLVVALALIPEAIAFSIIAGVDPKVGLYASFCIAVVIAFAGGRPGMISAATGAMALVMVTLVKDHGLQYLLAATLLTGVLQIAPAAAAGRADALRVALGHHRLRQRAGHPDLHGAAARTDGCRLAGLCDDGRRPGIIYGLFPTSPRPCRRRWCHRRADRGRHALRLGHPHRGRHGRAARQPAGVPAARRAAELETLRIILPYALTLAVVGLLESMMTASIVDDLTDTGSNKNRECVGQGVANIATGFIGGMAGCAMIGQSVINVKSGGRGRLSTLVPASCC
jgi:SulP family sulfate permease